MKVTLFMMLVLLMAYFHPLTPYPKAEPNLNFKRGDEVRLVSCHESECFYQGCTKLTYIAGQALDEDNAVWLLAEGCRWFQYTDLDYHSIRTAYTFIASGSEIVKGSNDRSQQ